MFQKVGLKMMLAAETKVCKSDGFSVIYGDTLTPEARLAVVGQVFHS